MSGKPEPSRLLGQLAAGLAAAFLEEFARLLSAPEPRPWPEQSRSTPSGQEASE